MRRLLSAILGAMLLAGLLPLQVLAAAPVADDQSVTTDEDTPLSITLTGSDADSDPLTFSVVDQPLTGTLTGTAPDLTYTPASDYNGPDSFTFKVNDTAADSNTATVTIDVMPVNDPPVANDDPGLACGNFGFGSTAASLPIAEDVEFAAAPGTACALGTNDIDVEGDPLTLELVAQADHGTATVDPDGGWSYMPVTDFYGSDSFTYQVSDGTDTSALATVRLWVVGVNDAPTFTGGDGVSVAEDSGPYGAAWATAISAGPGEADQYVNFAVNGISNPSLFEVAPAISATGQLSFTPAADWHGSSTVTISAHDNGGTEDWGVPGVTAADTSAPQTFTITVSQVNDAPTPAATSATLSEDVGRWLIPVAAVDIEADATTEFAVVTQAQHGLVETTAEITCDPPGTCVGAFLYTPAANYNGPDTFTFTASDGSATSDPATVTIAVTPVNDPPVADAQAVTTSEDTAKAVTLSGSDLEGSALTLRGRDQPWARHPHRHGTRSGLHPRHQLRRPGLVHIQGQRPHPRLGGCHRLDHRHSGERLARLQPSDARHRQEHRGSRHRDMHRRRRAKPEAPGREGAVQGQGGSVRYRYRGVHLHAQRGRQRAGQLHRHRQ